MKKLGFIDKLLFMLNSIVAAVLLLAYALPFVPPSFFSFLSVLSLSVPILLLCNFIFALYWLLRVKKQMLVSLLVLLLGYNHITTLYKFSSSPHKSSTQPNELSVFSYNVRLFNLYHWIPKENVVSDIVRLLKKQNSDIVALQEYQPLAEVKKLYPYCFESVSGKKVKSGQAILSKYPIINQGILRFKKSNNKAIFVDFIKEKDTLRVYNLHLESLHISPQVTELSASPSEGLIRQMGNRFEKQQQQALKIIRHQSRCSYKTIILGDFNNTAYSYIYKQFKKAKFLDAFEEAGTGFGRTFRFKFFPMRIDFIMADPRLSVASFTNYSEHLSDHYPIGSTLSW